MPDQVGPQPVPSPETPRFQTEESWVVEGRVLHLKLFGSPNQRDIQNIVQLFLSNLESIPQDLHISVRFHVIVDIREMERPDTSVLNLKLMLEETSKYIKHPRMGFLVVLAKETPWFMLVRTIMNLVLARTGAGGHIFTSEEDAGSYLIEKIADTAETKQKLMDYYSKES